jgi:transaldolase / glucose-6-phosphate isomerase
MNPTRRLHDEGQSLWLDYIRRSLFTDGRLARYLEEDGLRGMTSNPSIFEQAIGGSDDYDGQLAELLAADPRAGAEALYEELAITDIRLAADALRGVFDDSGGDDGYVSLEVSPYLAYDTAATVEAARRLWRRVERPNLMIKVPATAEGIPAIETLTAEGVNVNVTLMFSLAHYEAVARAYVAGLERLAAAEGADAARRVASVASFFVSRVDAKVDPRLDAIGSEEAAALRGTVAIANSKRAYHRFGEIFHGSPFRELAATGARVQRVLFGSTSTKDPAYSDVLYVEELIGPETVNTLPPKTIDAFRDHGEVRRSLDQDVGVAQERVAALGRLGIDLDAITEELQREGVSAFADSFDQLLAAIEGERRRLLAAGAAGRQQVFVGRALRPVKRRLQAWQDEGFGRRLWGHDRTLWSSEPVGELLDRLGWLTLADSMRGEADAIAAFAAEMAPRLDDVVLLGMGGSSLAPEVFWRVFGHRDGWPRLSVLDSTHPRAVSAVAAAIDPARTLFVVSSKSGTTMETASLQRWFWKLVSEAASVEAAKDHFVAVTDPGSDLAVLGHARGFRRVFTAPPEVGGRYSALTHFGLVPAALVGVDPRRLLDRALAAGFAFGPERPALVNEALGLGAALGELALAGRDKLVLLTSESLVAFPDWLEQLIAESTGKDGRGILPVVGAAPGGGADRVYCAITLDGDGEPAWGEDLARAEAAGHPVVRLRLAERHDLAAEMLRWEVAVAAAGAVLGIQPFDQPDVQLAKVLAEEAMSAEGGFDEEPAVAVGSGELPRHLEGLLERLDVGHYLAVHAYLPAEAATDEALARLQRAVAERTGRAVTVGYGPRFLHSTGQLHKGGPARGVFLQLVDEPGDALAVPESDFSFGKLIRGQAAGDRRALEQRGRHVLTVRVGEDAAADLGRLAEVLEAGAPAAV